jgi:UDP-N-acetyl-D-glucosamine dehydrogenase
VAESVLSLAVNGREHHLNSKLSPFRVPRHAAGNGDGDHGVLPSIAIVGLGYVGLPTAAALHGECERIIGIDINEQRLAEIAALEADLAEPDQMRLKEALAEGTLELTTQASAAAAADAVIICVPTPVDAEQLPDLAALRGACAAVVAHARPGQVIILTSTTYVGTTSELLTAPLAERGLVAGTHVHVAFSPERIDPGNPDHLQHETPRVVGGATAACTTRAATVIGRLTDAVYLVSSAEAAEATKLYENIFRAVSLALANEFADACGVLRLDPIEVTLAAATKPYGFLGVFPGPGVGGHCIPCDPHYLLWQLGRDGRTSPLIQQAMRSITLRPEQVVGRAAEMLAAEGRGLAGSRVIVIGASYKAGVRDLRESPALAIIAGLQRGGADVSYYDPLIPQLQLPGGQEMRAVTAPQGPDWDLAIVHTHQAEGDYSWVGDCPRVLDATYQFEAAPHRTVL